MSPSDPFDGGAEKLEFLTVLGLAQPVTVDDVKQAFLEKAKTAHPDHGGDAADFMRLQAAFEKATEYARFKEGRMKWLSNWVEQYAEQDQVVEAIKALGGKIEIESVDWLAKTIGPDFAAVQDRVVSIRLEGPAIGDGILLDMGAQRKMLAGLHRLELLNTKITSLGLRQLYECHSLERLDLSGTQVSAQALQTLLEKLPQVQTLILRNCGLDWWARTKLKLARGGPTVET